MRQYFDKLTIILKKYNITVLNGIFVGLMSVIACFAYNIMWQEQFMLDETDREQKPAMLWSKTDFHEQILQTPDAVLKVGEKCIWPAWPVTIDEGKVRKRKISIRCRVKIVQQIVLEAKSQ
ncbi:MAG: hypothetical protein IPG70_08325 [Moraxellaceae bacterium]|nr:hypothetical protein [Moraxellaceae bacterium]